MSADLKPDKGRGHIAIPTETMEQEFQNHYRKGYEAATSAAKAKIAALEAELHEQARQNGMGSEREARLMARVADLQHLLDIRPALNEGLLSAYRDWTGKVYACDIHAAFVSASSAAGEATNG